MLWARPPGSPSLARTCGIAASSETATIAATNAVAARRAIQRGKPLGHEVLVRRKVIVGQGLPVGKGRHAQRRREPGDLRGETLHGKRLGADDGDNEEHARRPRGGAHREHAAADGAGRDAEGSRTVQTRQDRAAEAALEARSRGVHREVDGPGEEPVKRQSDKEGEQAARKEQRAEDP